MVALKKLLGVYLIAVGAFVAAWFVVNPFFDAPAFWDVANYLMAAALVTALPLIVNRIFKEAREIEPRASRRLVEVNPGLCLTAGVAILFFRNWFLEISGQGDDISVTTGMVWIVVNVLFPLVAGTAGLSLCRDSAQR